MLAEPDPTWWAEAALHTLVFIMGLASGEMRGAVILALTEQSGNDASLILGNLAWADSIPHGKKVALEDAVWEACHKDDNSLLPLPKILFVARRLHALLPSAPPEVDAALAVLETYAGG